MINNPLVVCISAIAALASMIQFVFVFFPGQRSQHKRPVVLFSAIATAYISVVFYGAASGLLFAAHPTLFALGLVMTIALLVMHVIADWNA